MEGGLQTSMWAAGIPSSRRTYDLDRHDTRSRSLPPPMSGFAAPSATSTSTPGPRTTTTTITCPSRVKSFHRFAQAYRRVRWKCIDLGNSYGRALDPVDREFTVADAEINFKIDFHEFYAWVEKAIVLLLLVFGTSVKRGSSRYAGNSSSHEYHHNVLKALEEQGNPLYGILGSGDVRKALSEAKRLRNKWKDASGDKETPPLKMYNLHWIVTEILEGLKEAYLLAEKEVEVDLNNGDGDGMAVEYEWEWMVDSMDWEA
ncbi:hypothetical protein MAC_02001 [Metarhizium acridum CQMa 102]|uniref:Fungal specific transcription factor n=1 Tax=Metarhizium acridum (strain CQMa 102) TaxID=655827 RepID=E9DWK3_METAQ|nr:uncharacterized protein MAC_02001 [Metarhizium acridum CQMa 102]EFY92053.1 hypothetical protein MAC_02001 [Metarhizium acridum CQMa 102]